MNNLAIQLNNVSKKYILHHQKPTLVETFFSKKEEFWALKNISLKISQGEKLGIIGPNGSGKSTLLKIISGITSQTSGILKIHGRIASLIELTAGFHPDLTGEENIFINGLLLGMSRREIGLRYKKIVDFAELGRFIDSPFYTYSRGMMLRLGFSIAIYSNPEILIVDEVLSAGDEAFQEKSQKELKRLFREKTVIFVSHNLDLVKSFCPLVVCLDKGSLVFGGKTAEGIRYYLNSISKKS